MTNFEIAKKNYGRGLWSMDMLENLVSKGRLSVAEFQTITGELPENAGLDAVKERMVDETKEALAIYLAEHPLTWTDGKQYSVTEEKQALLMGNIAAYQLEVQGNPAAEITWNATGEECVEWAFADLCALAVAVKAYVKPLVAYQQAKEVEIMACGTAEAVAAVVVDYGAVGGNA